MSSSARRRVVLPALILALLGGCTTMPRNDCERFQQTRRFTNYDTVYVYSESETRQAAKTFSRAPRNNPIAARWYTLRTNRAQIGACDHLYLIKDVYVQRANNAAMTIEERREFYTATGQLIATKGEDVTEQLQKTGFYTASVPLPIPENAPAGRYRVVSHLITKTGNGPERTLASASAEFQVRP